MAPRKAIKNDEENITIAPPMVAEPTKTSQAMKSKTDKTASAKDDASAKVIQKSGVDGTTKIIVKYDCGFSNNLFIRGEGISSLSWNKGAPLKNVHSDEWVWETNRPFVQGEFKILINDQKFEDGENHKINNGSIVLCKPIFT